MSRLERTFPSMGTQAQLLLADRAPDGRASPRLLAAARQAGELLAELEQRWSRFRPDSDVRLLAAEPRAEVPAHPHVRALVRAGAWAGHRSRGIVDITLTADMVRAGYGVHWTGERAAGLQDALLRAPARRPATAHPAARWRMLAVDERAGTIRRPPSLVLDSGGIGKGLAADLVAEGLSGLRYVVDLGGDMALGHGGGAPHEIVVAHPITGGTAHVLHVGAGGVATSGIHRRLWLDDQGLPAHHLLDPATGRPAWTGLLTVTAVGRTALEAEVTAKTALLSGPRGARTLLTDLGGVLVAEDGSVEVVPPLRRLADRAVAAVAAQRL
jgi:thiamine biosynthesis lipoprotein